MTSSLVGSEMCIRDRCMDGWMDGEWVDGWMEGWMDGWMGGWMETQHSICLLYTSDAADDM
eukprot:11241249-Prorocentrum_lima.AAC.1